MLFLLQQWWVNSASQPASAEDMVLLLIPHVKPRRNQIVSWEKHFNFISLTCTGEKVRNIEKVGKKQEVTKAEIVTTEDKAASHQSWRFRSVGSSKFPCYLKGFVSFPISYVVTAPYSVATIIAHSTCVSTGLMVSYLWQSRPHDKLHVSALVSQFTVFSFGSKCLCQSSVRVFSIKRLLKLSQWASACITTNPYVEPAVLFSYCAVPIELLFLPTGH